MRITLFGKCQQICYSTSQSQQTSAYEEELIARGWRLLGVFHGRDIYSCDIPTMTKALKKL